MRRILSLAALAALAIAPTHPAAAQSAAVAAILAQDDAGTVLGQPLFAVEQTVEVRTLADGTHLTRRTEEHKWRDTQGRYRRESTVVTEGQPPVFHTAFIIDPAANTVAILDLDRKTAVVTHLPATGPYALHPYINLDDKPIEALPGVNVKVEKLEGKTIAGVYAVGRRVTRTRPPGTIGNDRPVVSVAERWGASGGQPLLLTLRPLTAPMPRSS